MSDRDSRSASGCAMAFVVVSVLFALLLVGCIISFSHIDFSGELGDPSLPSSFGSSSTYSTGTGVTPTTGGASLLFGTAHTSVDGMIKVTAYGLEDPIQPDPGVTPAPVGGRARVFAAADVEVCAISPIRYMGRDVFALSGSSTFTPRPMKDPTFPETAFSVPEGSCVRGWISFEVDQAVPHRVVMFTDHSFGVDRVVSWGRA
jgi:hypothetical protein